MNIKMENEKNEDFNNKDISKIINYYDQDISNLDSEYSNARMTIINEIQKYNLKLIELEFVYKTEKMKINEKRNKFLRNQLNKQKKKKKNETDGDEPVKRYNHIIV